MTRIEELRAEYRRLTHSMEFAYAMGATRTMGPRDPRLEWVVQRVDELRGEIAHLRARDDGGAV